jgi:hypothetical protein
MEHFLQRFNRNADIGTCLAAAALPREWQFAFTGSQGRPILAATITFHFSSVQWNA